MMYLDVHAQMSEEQAHLRNVGACNKKSLEQQDLMIDVLYLQIDRSPVDLDKDEFFLYRTGM